MKEDSEDFYKPSGSATVADSPAPRPVSSRSSSRPPSRGSFSWVASEYIEHSRGAQWYLLLAISTVAVSAIIYWLTKEVFATAVVIIVGLIVGFYAGRKPRQVEYELSVNGIRIGGKTYDYSQFRSFALMKEGVLNSVQLIPLKKFMPPISAFYDAGDEEKITDILGEHLPFEDVKPSSIDRLSRRLKF